MGSHRWGESAPTGARCAGLRAGLGALGAAPVADSIAVTGNKRNSATSIVQLSGLVAGRALNYRDIQRAIQALYGSGQFDDVSISQSSTPEKTVLIIAVRERAARGGLDISGRLRRARSQIAVIAGLPALAANAEFLRTVAAPADEVLRAANAAGVNWINAPLSANGRLELTRWLREQAVSTTRHRYGNMPAVES